MNGISEIERLTLPDESAMLLSLMEALPIHATRVGYRTDSSALETRIGAALFAAARAFTDSLEAAEVSS